MKFQFGTNYQAERSSAKHRRRSIRLKNYDYTTPGAYFVTIYTYQRECLFGDVVVGNHTLKTN